MTNVTLARLKPNRQTIEGKLTSSPKLGSSLIIQYLDGMHEYVTTPVVRIFQVINDGSYYIETTNSRYKLQIEP